jgi:hypothetical protein
VTASRVVAAWAGLYTRGLHPGARDERLAELASDLWEHRAACGDGLRLQLAILSRCLRGMPADLAWRRACRNGRLTAAGAARGLGWVVFGLAAALLLAVTGAAAAPLVGLNEHPDWDPESAAFYARGCAVLFAMLAGGLAVVRWLPRLGAGLASLGALGTAGFLLFGVVAFGPAALAVTAGALVLGRRRREGGASPSRRGLPRPH